MESQCVSFGCWLRGNRISCDFGRCRHFENSAKRQKINRHDWNERRLTRTFHLIVITISNIFRYSEGDPQSDVYHNSYYGQRHDNKKYRRYLKSSMTLGERFVRIILLFPCSYRQNCVEIRFVLSMLFFTVLIVNRRPNPIRKYSLKMLFSCLSLEID